MIHSWIHNVCYVTCVSAIYICYIAWYITGYITLIFIPDLQQPVLQQPVLQGDMPGRAIVQASHCKRNDMPVHMIYIILYGMVYTTLGGTTSGIVWYIPPCMVYTTLGGTLGPPMLFIVLYHIL